MLLEAQGLTRRFGGVVAVDQVSITVADGELVGVVVHPEGLLTHDVVIQVRFLERGDDAALFVRMREEDLAHLQRFESER